MSLSAAKVQNAKPKEKNYKLFDEKGLFLLVNTTGAKYWRCKYYFAGKEKLLALGVYPEVSLSEAREARDNARKLLSKGTDPGIVKQVGKVALKTAVDNSFELIAREWFAKHSTRWVEGHKQKVWYRLEKNVFPWLGNRPITHITAPELLLVLRRIEKRGAIESAHRVMQSCSKVFRYAVATGRAERDPAQDLKGALQPVDKSKHYTTILEPKEIGKLLVSIDGYHGNCMTKCAMQLAPLLFVRPGELRKAEWKEIDFENQEWRIPAKKMKMRAAHIVPLSKQALSVLEEMRPLTGHTQYVFPSVLTEHRPMSENTVNTGLRRLGYSKEEITGHGFRAMASTLLNEQGWNRDAIERQLAHTERDGVRAAYNHAEYLPERRKMMQHWADYLDSLKMKIQAKKN